MAVKFAASYRGVAQNEDDGLKWREITIQTGGRQGGLQNGKLPEVAGGFTYSESGRQGSPICNRCIYWRVLTDVLELVEVSLDFELSNAALRIRFLDTAIVSGVSIHETHGQVFVLVTTLGSLHRLVFPHPSKLHRYDEMYLTSAPLPSIFAPPSPYSVGDGCNNHVLNMGTEAAYQVHAASSHMAANGEVLFALATNVGTLMVITLPAYGAQGTVTQLELRQSSLLGRMWTGLLSSVVKAGSESACTNSLVIRQLGQDVVVLAACHDHKIRIWSTQTGEVVLTADLLSYVSGNRHVKLCGDGHLLRASESSTSDQLHLAVYVSLSSQRQFCVFLASNTGGALQFQHVYTASSEEAEIVDFAVCGSQLWVLGRNCNGAAMCRVTDFSKKAGSNDVWKLVTLDSPLPGDFFIPPHQDPRDAYMTHIFLPGQFSAKAIVRALHIFKRTLDASFSAEMDISVDVLKLEVTAAVEHEIHLAASDYEMDTGEFYHLQVQHWNRFYSNCVQYQEVCTRPMGMFADAITGLVGIVHKAALSCLRPAHIVEHLYLLPSLTCDVQALGDPAWDDADFSMQCDVLTLCDCMKMMRDELGVDIAYELQRDMYHTQNPRAVAETCLAKLLAQPCMAGQLPWQHEIEVHIQACQDIVSAVRTLICLLDFTTQSASVEDMDSDLASAFVRLFASPFALKLVSGTVTQLAEVAFLMSRDLLLLLTMLTQDGTKTNLSVEVVDQIQRDLIVGVVKCVRAHFVVLWASHTVATPVSMSMTDHIGRQLDALEMTDTKFALPYSKMGAQPFTLVGLAVKGQCSAQAKSLITQDVSTSQCLWETFFTPVCTALARVICPSSRAFIFPETLWRQCQYVGLQDYIRLTREWCDVNMASRYFLLSLAYLNTGEQYKAVEVAMDAVSGISTDDFLIRLIGSDSDDLQQLEVLFYLKTIRLLEQFSFPHLVVSLATTAISVASEDDPNLATLYSKVFKYQLELGHNEEAYTAMVSNTDASRRKDCLRQLLVVLSERGELETLVQFPYVGLHDDVVNVLESRARAVDLNKHNFYDLLYAFHVHRNNYRKAGSVMYEFGLRLGVEPTGVDGLQRQANCYLAAINALRLVNPDYAWFVKPISETQGNGDMIEDTENGLVKPKVDVLELSDIQKEYAVVDARLRLVRCQQDVGQVPLSLVGPYTTPQEVVSLLCAAGLFDVSVVLCRLHALPLTPVLEEVAARCVSIARDDSAAQNAWQWLQYNDVGAAGEGGPADAAWQLLQGYLSRYPDRAQRYHQAVATRLLSHDFELPAWFVAAYKVVNAPELLRLYLDFDLLEHAALLALEYIDAVLGCGGEYFGLTSSLRFGSPAVWLPYTSLNQLLAALQAVNKHPLYAQLYDDLDEKLQGYFRTLESVTQDTIRAASQTPHLQAMAFTAAMEV